MNRSTVLWLTYLQTKHPSTLKELSDELTPAAIATGRYCLDLSIELARDAVQETWIVVLKFPEKFDPDKGEFDHFFKGIAFKKGQEQQRKSIRRGVREGATGIDIDVLVTLNEAAALDETSESQFWDHALACWSRLSLVEQFLLVGTKQARFKAWFNVLRQALDVEGKPLPSKEDFKQHAPLKMGRQQGWKQSTIDQTLDAMAKGVELPGAARGKLHRAWLTYKKCMGAYLKRAPGREETTDDEEE